MRYLKESLEVGNLWKMVMTLFLCLSWVCICYIYLGDMYMYTEASGFSVTWMFNERFDGPPGSSSVIGLFSLGCLRGASL